MPATAAISAVEIDSREQMESTNQTSERTGGNTQAEIPLLKIVGDSSLETRDQNEKSDSLPGLPRIAHDVDESERSSDVRVTEGNKDLDFKSMQLSEVVLQGLAEAGFIRPSPIQHKAIPLGKCGFDLLLQAKSGTGKTCVFSVLALEEVDPSEETIQVLVVEPCREIALQAAHVIETLGEPKKVAVKTFIGGRALNQDVADKDKARIAVGTPGRLVHLVSKFGMNLKHVRLVVLDEADKLMEQSFFKDLVQLFIALPREKQVIAVSATYPDDLDQFIVRFMRAPYKVQLNNEMPVLVAVNQFTVDVRKFMNDTKGYLNNEEADRVRLLCLVEIFKIIPFTQCIVFCARQLAADNLYHELQDRDFSVALLSALMPQNERVESFKKLQTGQCKILVATDLAARGLDSEGVDLVINFHCPVDMATYLHRVGRAGRFGGTGIALTFYAFSTESQIITKFKETVQFNIRVIENAYQLEQVRRNADLSSLRKPFETGDEETAGAGISGWRNDPVWARRKIWSECVNSMDKKDLLSAATFIKRSFQDKFPIESGEEGHKKVTRLFDSLVSATKERAAENAATDEIVEKLMNEEPDETNYEEDEIM